MSIGDWEVSMQVDFNRLQKDTKKSNSQEFYTLAKFYTFRLLLEIKIKKGQLKFVDW